MKTSAIPLVVLILNVYCVIFTNALVDEDKIELEPYNLVAIQQFGFEIGGKAVVTAQAKHSEEGIYLFLCTYTDSLDLWANEQSICSSMRDNTTLSAKCAFRRELPVHKESFYVVEEDSYSLLLINCNTTTVLVDISYAMMNLGSSHLTLGMKTVPISITILCLFWIGVLSYWISKGRAFGFGFFPISLHSVFTFIGLIKTAQMMVSYRYWNVMEYSGRDFSKLLEVAAMLQLFFELGLFVLILLIAKGWQITRPALRPTEFRTMVLLFLIVTATVLLFDDSKSFFLLSVGLLFMYVPPVIVAIHKNVQTLKHQQFWLESNAVNKVASNQVRSTIRLYSRLRVLCIGLFISLMVLAAVNMLLHSRLQGLRIILNECVFLLTVIVLSHLVLDHIETFGLVTSHVALASLLNSISSVDV